MRRLLQTGVMVGSLAAGYAAAQPLPDPLFSETGPSAAVAAVSPGDVVIDRRVVGMRLDRLFDAAVDRVLLNVSDRNWIARFDRLDRDVMGHRTWVGTIDDIENSHVSFAERNGIVSGLIDAGSETYQVRTAAVGTYLLERIDAARACRARAVGRRQFDWRPAGHGERTCGC